ncbi:hypothetical protein D3C73_1034650 [compost metagenome]
MVADLLHLILCLIEQQRFQDYIHTGFGEHRDVLSDFVIDAGVDIIITRKRLGGRKVEGNVDCGQSGLHQLLNPLCVQKAAVGIQLGLNAPGGAVANNFHTIFEFEGDFSAGETNPLKIRQLLQDADHFFAFDALSVISVIRAAVIAAEIAVRGYPDLQSLQLIGQRFVQLQ